MKLGARATSPGSRESHDYHRALLSSTFFFRPVHAHVEHFYQTIWAPTRKEIKGKGNIIIPLYNQHAGTAEYFLYFALFSFESRGLKRNNLNSSRRVFSFPFVVVKDTSHGCRRNGRAPQHPTTALRPRERIFNNSLPASAYIVKCMVRNTAHKIVIRKLEIIQFLSFSLGGFLLLPPLAQNIQLIRFSLDLFVDSA